MTLSQFDRENVNAIMQDPRKDWFTAQLMRLIAKADSHHRALLAKGFPEEVALVEQYGLTSVPKTDGDDLIPAEDALEAAANQEKWR